MQSACEQESHPLFCGTSESRTVIGQYFYSDTDTIVASYWLDKIKAEARQIFHGKWLPLRFVFNEKELQYSEEVRMKQVKTENA